MNREKQPLEHELPSELLHLIEKREGSRRAQEEEKVLNCEALDDESSNRRSTADRRQNS